MTQDINPLALEALKKLEEMDYGEGGEGGPSEADANFSAEKSEADPQATYDGLKNEMQDAGFFHELRGGTNYNAFDVAEADRALADILIADEKSAMDSVAHNAAKMGKRNAINDNPSLGAELTALSERFNVAMQSPAASSDVEAYKQYRRYIKDSGQDEPPSSVGFNEFSVENGRAMAWLNNRLKDPNRNANWARSYLEKGGGYDRIMAKRSEAPTSR